MDSRSMTGKEQLLRVSQYTGVTQRKSLDGSDAPDTRASSLKGYKVVCKSDLVINIMLAWNGSMGVSKFDGIVSPAYCVYRLNPEVIPWYFHELLRLPAYKGRIKSASTGVVESRLRLYSDDLGCIEALLPPPAEQAAIVRFLDHWNGRLEKAIRAKRRVIALLQEQKQAIIHRAVTRGLDPNVKLKDSGIPWLGDIPVHWDILRLKNACRIRGGFAFKTEWFQAEGIPVIRMSNLKRGVLDVSESVRINPNQCVPGFELQEGDILYGLSGSVGTTGSLGNFAVVSATDLPAQLNQRVARFRPNNNALKCEFLVLLLQTSIFYEQVLADTTGTAQFNVSTNDVARVTFPLPSRSEQMQIVTAIENATEPLTTAIARYEREITLLREYRTRLTADVVTGKLDVRAAAAQLPEEAEDEPLPDPERPEEETELEEIR
jgi:type I restriction enzyme, S subunit